MNTLNKCSTSGWWIGPTKRNNTDFCIKTQTLCFVSSILRQTSARTKNHWDINSVNYVMIHVFACVCCYILKWDTFKCSDCSSHLPFDCFQVYMKISQLFDVLSDFWTLYHCMVSPCQISYGMMIKCIHLLSYCWCFCFWKLPTLPKNLFCFIDHFVKAESKCPLFSMGEPDGGAEVELHPQKSD